MAEDWSITILGCAKSSRFATNFCYKWISVCYETSIETKVCKNNQEQEADFNYEYEDEPSSEELDEILNLMVERYGRYD